MYRFVTVGCKVNGIASGVVYVRVCVRVCVYVCVCVLPPPSPFLCFPPWTHKQHTHTHTHTHTITVPVQLDDMEIREAAPLPGQVGGGVSVINIAQTNTDSSTSAETDTREFTASRAHYVYST